jgi:hypothetical protein
MTQYKQSKGSESFPWGDRDPVGGYKVGDVVGIIHSDHEDYLFDNPNGVVTAIAVDDEGMQQLTVTVETDVAADRCFLIGRPEESTE